MIGSTARLLGGLSAVLLCASCGGSSGAGDGSTTIRFASYNYGTPDLGGKGTQQLIDEFQQAHPKIKIKPEGSTAGEIYARLHAQAAAGNAPDVAQIGWSKAAAAVRNLPVKAVQDIKPADFTAASAGIMPQALAAGKFDGKQVAMPYTLSTPTLFYNADLFRKAKLDPEKPPTTWEQVKAQALAIRKADKGAQGVYLSAANTAKSDFLTQSLINSNGGRLVSDAGKIQLNTPQAVGALKTLQDLIKSGAGPAISDDHAVALFKSGKLGMYVTSTALTAGLQKAAANSFTLRTAGLPGFGSTPVKPTYSGAGLFVLSKDKAKAEAAWEFVKFLTSDRGFTIITEKIGYLPLRTSIVEDPNGLGGFLKSNPAIMPAVKQFENVVPYQSMPGANGDRARQMLQDDAVAPIMLNGADPDRTCTTVADRIGKLLPA